MTRRPSASGSFTPLTDPLGGETLLRVSTEQVDRAESVDSVIVRPAVALNGIDVPWDDVSPPHAPDFTSGSGRLMRRFGVIAPRVDE